MSRRTSSPSRRVWLLGAAGVAAVGAGLAWRLLAERRFDEETGNLWTLRFARPEGGELAMASLRGRPLLLNFWATWCPPCVKEMPEIDRFRAALVARGGEVVGIAVDSPTPVREFLRRTPVGYPIALAGFEGSDLSRRLGNAQGALPFTVLFGRDGRIVQRKLGETTAAELEGWLALL
ncbi:MAG: TlpA family protein disulfide reductase [Rubrivivax sp.]|nr:TlpA family protein disulfide reductase [Rubrivivax sp.]